MEDVAQSYGGEQSYYDEGYYDENGNFVYYEGGEAANWNYDENGNFVFYDHIDYGNTTSSDSYNCDISDGTGNGGESDASLSTHATEPSVALVKKERPPPPRLRNGQVPAYYDDEETGYQYYTVRMPSYSDRKCQ